MPAAATATKSAGRPPTDTSSRGTGAQSPPAPRAWSHQDQEKAVRETIRRYSGFFSQEEAMRDASAWIRVFLVELPPWIYEGYLVGNLDWAKSLFTPQQFNTIKDFETFGQPRYTWYSDLYMVGLTDENKVWAYRPALPIELRKDKTLIEEHYWKPTFWGRVKAFGWNEGCGPNPFWFEALEPKANVNELQSRKDSLQ